MISFAQKTTVFRTSNLAVLINASSNYDVTIYLVDDSSNYDYCVYDEDFPQTTCDDTKVNGMGGEEDFPETTCDDAKVNGMGGGDDVTEGLRDYTAMMNTAMMNCFYACDGRGHEYALLDYFYACGDRNGSDFMDGCVNY